MNRGSSGLTLRTVQVSKKPVVELLPKPIGLWLKELPVADVEEAAHRLHRLLVDLNQSVTTAENRLAILKILEPTCQTLVNALKGYFVNNHISLTEKHRKLAALVQALQAEISIGYHAVIDALLIVGLKRSTKKSYTYAIFMAMKYHSNVIFLCYQLYTSVPGRIWKELYCLYQLASEQELLYLDVNSGDGDLNTIYHSFIRVIMLGITNPYQLRQSEIALVWNLLPNYTEFCRLETHSFDKYTFYLNLNAGNPPVQPSLYQKQVDENRLKVSLSLVIEQIKLNLTKISENDPHAARKTMIYRHLMHCWSQGTQRNFARTPCRDKIQVTIGLGATHYLLKDHLLKKKAKYQESKEPNSTDKTLDQMEGSLKHATLVELNTPKRQSDVKTDQNYLSTSRIPNQEVWNKLFQSSQSGPQFQPEKSPEDLIEKRSRESIVRDNYKVQTCNLINMSPAGFCIQIPATQLPKHAQTGEIIGFIDGEEADLHWSIGVVRWVRRRVKDNNIQMGIQLLAPDVAPISVRLKNNKSSKNVTHRALLLPALTGVGQAETIVTNPLAFSLRDRLVVNEISSEYEVRLKKEISSSSSSRQFSFEKIVNHTNNKLKESDTASSSRDKITGIWDII
ncbi:MAG: hypothetical protein Q9M92_05335 [Enterobacterales bacterium]|nr:hypothetical protein [Enterobacterales bacterium]